MKLTFLPEAHPLLFKKEVVKELILIAGMFCIANTSVVKGDIIGQPFGTNTPPATLGGYTMTPFPPDSTGNGQGESLLSSPLGGVISFNTGSYGVFHTQVGGGVADTWSQGYEGDIYSLPPPLNESNNSITVYLPPNTGAFYLYAGHPIYGNEPITVQANDGTSLTQFTTDYNDASGFGFYSTAGESISSLTISIPDQNGFAFGELGIALVPEPTPCALVLLGIAAFTIRRMWKRPE